VPSRTRRQDPPAPADGPRDPRPDNIDECHWPRDIEEKLTGRPWPKNIDENKPARPMHIDENQRPRPGLGPPRPKHIDESPMARPVHIDENQWPLPGLGRPPLRHIDENKMARPMYIDEKPGQGHGNIDESKRPGRVGKVGRRS
jgi:hypothetical protein